MKNLYIIGARGFGREVYNLFLLCKESLKEIECQGFLDDDFNVLDNYKGYPPIVASVENYIPKENDVFICALGDVKYKKKYAEIILSKGGEFISLIHPAVEFGLNSRIGKGVIIKNLGCMNCDVTIGDFVTIMDYVVLGHDSVVNDWSHLGAFTFLGGFSEVGKSVTLHPGVRLLPHKRIGDNSVIGAGSVVISNVKADKSVFGVPAKSINI